MVQKVYCLLHILILTYITISFSALFPCIRTYDLGIYIPSLTEVNCKQLTYCTVCDTYIGINMLCRISCLEYIMALTIIYFLLEWYS